MRFFATVLSGATLLAVALGLTIDTFPSNAVAGETYTITYSPKDNTPTTFILRAGQSGNLDTVGTLTTTATGGTFQWTVPKDIANRPNYAFEIRRGSESNFSGQFPVTGGTGTVSSAVASASSAIASARSSASAAVSSALSRISASASASASAASSASEASASASSASAASASHSSASSRATSTPSSSSPPASSGAASSLNGSPMAAVAGLFAAFAYLA